MRFGNLVLDNQNALKKTLSRPLHPKLKKIRGLFKDLLRNVEKWISRTHPKIHTLGEEAL